VELLLLIRRQSIGVGDGLRWEAQIHEGRTGKYRFVPKPGSRPIHTDLFIQK
jgi:hypothetical protein